MKTYFGMNRVKAVIKNLLRDDENPKNMFYKAVKELRGWLSAIAALVASVTYQAGLNPPGGFWSDNDIAKGKIAGAPILLHESPARYYAFAVGHATAFASSLYVLLWLGLCSHKEHADKTDDGGAWQWLTALAHRPPYH
ncbi:hypothetical protein ACP70R_004156 [Stipagrostis hirtigluma subsp. patula]